jgi:coenzyme F420-0:L-glutamate ligase / coenzyme F420-1:gamma-L-glutamate ligase
LISIRSVEGLPEIEPGVPLGAMLANAGEPRDDEILVVSQKAVSKAEGRVRDLASVAPGERAAELAADLGKDPRLVELILGEASAVIRAEAGVLIVETRSGLICANAGIDSSNAPRDGAVVLLPEDPDGSARRLRAEIRSASGRRPAVVVADSFGRPWRVGQTDVAIGCAGLLPLDDWRGRRDRSGRELAATRIAIADEVAAAASLARHKASGEPAAIIAGLARHVAAEDGPGAAALRRAPDADLFR